MPFEVKQEKAYEKDLAAVYAAAQKAVAGLGGEVERSNPGAGELVVKFDKKILGKVLGDRTHLEIKVNQSPGGASIVVDAHPLDAVGRKLMFGARKGVTETVVSWFFAHLEHHLAK